MAQRKLATSFCPNAFEHEGKPYIANTQGTADCVQSMLPKEVLAV